MNFIGHHHFWLLTLSCPILATHILLLLVITSQLTTCTKILSQALLAVKPEVMNQDNVNSLEHSNQMFLGWFTFEKQLINENDLKYILRIVLILFGTFNYLPWWWFFLSAYMHLTLMRSIISMLLKLSTMEDILKICLLEVTLILCVIFKIGIILILLKHVS